MCTAPVRVTNSPLGREHAPEPESLVSAIKEYTVLKSLT